MKTAELTGAILDFWVARAEGIPAEQLEIRTVPRTELRIVVRKRLDVAPRAGAALEVLNYSQNWLQGGPLIEKHHLLLESDMGQKWQASVLLHHSDGNPYWGFYEAPTVLIAVCRAVVRAAFGDEVEDLPCAG